MPSRPRCLFPLGLCFRGAWGCMQEQWSTAMLVCNLRAWIRALEHAVLETEDPCVCEAQPPTCLSPVPARSLALGTVESSLGSPQT